MVGEYLISYQMLDSWGSPHVYLERQAAITSAILTMRKPENKQRHMVSPYS
jgi:hypothetical protein